MLTKKLHPGTHVDRDTDSLYTSVQKRRMLGPNHKRLHFLTPRHASLCILQRQIHLTNWCRFTAQNMKRHVNAVLHILSLKRYIRKDAAAFCAEDA